MVVMMWHILFIFYLEGVLVKVVAVIARPARSGYTLLVFFLFTVDRGCLDPQLHLPLRGVGVGAVVHFLSP